MENSEKKQAGYYENGQMVCTWEELLANTELSVMDDGTLISDNNAETGNLDKINLKSLTGEIVIDSHVINVDNSVFESYLNLSNIIISEDVTEIEDYAFMDCTGLTGATIPSSIIRINSMVFYGCTGLTNIEIPESVTSIGVRVFEGCTGLTNITISKDQLSKIQCLNGISDDIIINTEEGFTTLGKLQKGNFRLQPYPKEQEEVVSLDNILSDVQNFAKKFAKLVQHRLTKVCVECRIHIHRVKETTLEDRARRRSYVYQILKNCLTEFFYTVKIGYVME